MLVASFLAQAGFVWLSNGPTHIIETGDDLPLIILNIFFSNIVLSAFVMVTLTGFVFFGLSAVFLLMRAWMWGVLLNGLSTSEFLFVLPTLVLEGEGYVLAALAGVNLGLSWLKPQWAYKEEGLSRQEAVKRALKDCAHMYILVAAFLFVAAVVEAITIFLVMTS